MDLDINLLELSRVAFSYPAIDNHAHALLREEHRNTHPFEGVITEANSCKGTYRDAPTTLACYRATAQLAKLYGLGPHADWEDVKERRRELAYEALCRLCFEPTRIQCILIDDGLGAPDQLYELPWHDQFTLAPTRRIVRIETVAEDILRRLIGAQLELSAFVPSNKIFVDEFKQTLCDLGADPNVAGFKSIVCYRTGLDVVVGNIAHEDMARSIISLGLILSTTGKLRIAVKCLNDFIVGTAMAVARDCGKPIQFHTGLGDSDITLKLSSPAHLQPLIKAYPTVKVVLLHGAYPFTREAGYLASVYPNVYLDFGEVFPFVSADGQRDVIRQVLELCPTNKILWSSDGHYWPESYYLGAMQARRALYEVLEASVRKGDLTTSQAIGIVKRALFENANDLYNLELSPNFVTHRS